MGIKENDQRYIAHTYARFDVVLTHGKGCRVYDEKEKEYLDLTAGIGVNALGFADEEWAAAVAQQAKTLPHVSNLYYSQPDSDVAKLLCERCGFTNMFFANSGAEANEGAIKVARKYSSDRYGTGRHEIITLVNSFHGRTITALSATGQDHFHQHFDPFTPGFVHVIANDINDLISKISDRTCAVMMEMIQGEGGVLPLEHAFVDALAQQCKEKDILLIVDEVQTGVGRCGTFYVYEQYGIRPDIVTTAKGLGNGLPIGGVLLSEKTANVFGPGDHGTTFGGNPIACAGARVVLNRIDDQFLADVTKKGAYVEQRLNKMPHVVQVNGLGLMRGVVLDGLTARDAVLACIEKGVLLLTAKDKLRLLPPLTITMDELKEAMDIIEDVLTHMA